MTAPPPQKKKYIYIYTLFFCTSLMYRLLLCAHRTHCCLYLHEARGISRALMLDWLKSAELNTPPSLQNPSSLKRHVDYTDKSVHFFYNLLLFIYFLEQGAFKIIVSKSVAKGQTEQQVCVNNWGVCVRAFARELFVCPATSAENY